VESRTHHDHNSHRLTFQNFRKPHSQSAKRRLMYGGHHIRSCPQEPRRAVLTESGAPRR
jgi:hypothetical protein